MKKILSLLLALTLVFALVACSNEKDTTSTSSDLPVSSVTDTPDFEKPQNYASVLLVTINPQFKLYLDKDSNVLAIEAVNHDAKTMKDSIIYKNQNFETVIKNIVTTANDKGFIKENANINFEIVEQKDETVNTADILTIATTSANLAASEIEVTVNIDIVDIGTPVGTDKNDEMVSQNNTTSKTENSEIKSPSTPENTPTNENSSFNSNESQQNSQTPHSHSYDTWVALNPSINTPVEQKRVCTICSHQETRTIPYSQFCLEKEMSIFNSINTSRAEYNLEPFKYRHDLQPILDKLVYEYATCGNNELPETRPDGSSWYSLLTDTDTYGTLDCGSGMLFFVGVVFGEDDLKINKDYTEVTVGYSVNSEGRNFVIIYYIKPDDNQID